MRELSEVRVDIDRVDEQIVKLYAERMKLVHEVGEIKGSTGRPVRDPKREEEKLAKIRELAKAASVEINKEVSCELLPPDAVGAGAVKVYETIIDTACSLEDVICAEKN